MNIGIVGCGYAADFYLANLGNYPKIRLIQVYDRIPDRMYAIAEEYDCESASSLEQILKNSLIDIILNLTTPESHYDINKQALLAGKHVYSEKPMTLNTKEGEELLQLALTRGLKIASAPCSVYSHSVEKTKEIILSKELGEPLIARAEISEGMIHKMSVENWISKSGCVWPADSEFEIGVTLEHGSYVLSWLVYLFGPIKKYSGYSKTVIKSKKNKMRKGDDWSQFTVLFESSIIAEITLSIIDEPNHRLKIICEHGSIEILDVWNNWSPIVVTKTRDAPSYSPHSYIDETVTITPPSDTRSYSYNDTHNMDQMLGVDKLISAISTDCELVIDGRSALEILKVLFHVSSKRL